jgi:hypothetical protein
MALPPLAFIAAALLHWKVSKVRTDTGPNANVARPARTAFSRMSLKVHRLKVHKGMK